jgi:hypothetical protein
VRRSALGVRMDRDARGRVGRWSSDVGPAPVGRTAAEGGSNGGMNLVRPKLRCGSEKPWREATRPQLGGDRSRPLTGQRLRTAARAQISAHGGRTGSADESDADNERCKTVREEHEDLSRS